MARNILFTVIPKHLTSRYYACEIRHLALWMSKKPTEIPLMRDLLDPANA